MTPGTLAHKNGPERHLAYEPSSAREEASLCTRLGFVILFKVATLKIHMSLGSPYIKVSSPGAEASCRQLPTPWLVCPHA